MLCLCMTSEKRWVFLPPLILADEEMMAQSRQKITQLAMFFTFFSHMNDVSRFILR